MTLLVPYDRPEVLPRLYRESEVLEATNSPNGISVAARVGERELALVREFLVHAVARRTRA
ncbi:MAG: hypothetical protein H0U16_06490 [Actinobacteria bacterium]|nr:hypothetical protein [Actinomycetota bacterium]